MLLTTEQSESLHGSVLWSAMCNHLIVTSISTLVETFLKFVLWVNLLFLFPQLYLSLSVYTPFWCVFGSHSQVLIQCFLCHSSNSVRKRHNSLRRNNISVAKRRFPRCYVFFSIKASAYSELVILWGLIFAGDMKYRFYFYRVYN